jgi:hypothetical protein
LGKLAFERVITGFQAGELVGKLRQTRVFERGGRLTDE